MMLYTTFALLRKHDARESSYRKLAKHLGGVRAYSRDTPIAIDLILDSNGFADALWCLRATTEPCERFARLLAVAFAREVQHLMIDPRSLAALDVAQRHANGLATDDKLREAQDAAQNAALAAAWDAAQNAARDAAWAAAWAAAQNAAQDAAQNAAGAAAWAAAQNAAQDAAWAAAQNAARDAAWAAARARQAEIFRAALSAHDANKPA